MMNVYIVRTGGGRYMSCALYVDTHNVVCMHVVYQLYIPCTPHPECSACMSVDVLCSALRMHIVYVHACCMCHVVRMFICCMRTGTSQTSHHQSHACVISRVVNAECVHGKDGWDMSCALYVVAHNDDVA